MAGKFKVRSEPTHRLCDRRLGVTRRWTVITPEGDNLGFGFVGWENAIYWANKFARRRKVQAENRALLWPV